VDDLLARLRAALATGPKVRLAILFGSRAIGRARPDSDVDVGIVPVDAAMTLPEELALGAALSKALVQEVDLVRLDQDNPLLGREAALRGRCIVEERPGVFAAYRANAMSIWIDYDETVAPHRQRFLARISERR
jgi:predicted nucleotidyltransferase